jgi:hypothetical protein
MSNKGLWPLSDSLYKHTIIIIVNGTKVENRKKKVNQGVKQMLLQVLVFYVVTPCSSVTGHHLEVAAARSSKMLVSHHITTQCHNLKMEAALSSKTMICYHNTTWCHNLEWRQQGPVNQWYPTTLLHGVTTQKTMT